MVCLCLFCFCPSAFFFLFLFTCSHFHLLSDTHSPSSPLPHPLLPPSFHSGSAGVHMIKQGTQVITWHCQIKRPLIQMRSEISKSGVAFAATTYPHRRQRGDLRARGTCREATTTLSLPFLDKYHRWKRQSQTCPGSLVTADLFVLHILTCPLLARGVLYRGRSATLTRGIFQVCSWT